MFAAAVLAAGVACAVRVVVMIAARLGIIGERTVKQCLHRRVRAAAHAAVKPDAGFGECRLRAAANDAASHIGRIARPTVLDRLVGEYLAAHPGATVMNLACGLDTRCYRMQGYAHWYNLDLPETIAVRAALLPESGSISQLAMSAMDDWGSEVKEPSGPALVIIEGLTMYLTQADVQRIFAVIAGRFPAATVFTETMHPMVVKRFKEKSIAGSKAKITWGVKDGRALAAVLPGFRLAGEHCLTEGMAAFVPVYRLLDKLPLIRNISNRIAILQGTGEEDQPECGGAIA